MLMFSLKKSQAQGRSAIWVQRWHASMAHIESKIFVSNALFVYLPQQLLHNLITYLSILCIDEFRCLASVSIMDCMKVSLNMPS